MFNNYYNPYNQYPYTTFGQQQINPQMQQPMYQNQQVQNQQNQMQQQMNQQSQMQQNYLPLALVDNVDEVKRFIVQPNQVVYLKVRNSNIIYEKSANNQGEYALNEYSRNNPSTEKSKQQTKEEYVYLDDFNAFKEDLEARMDKLSGQIEKRFKNENTTRNRKED